MRVTRVQYDPDTMSCHVVLRLDDLAAILRTVNLKKLFSYIVFNLSVIFDE